MEKRKIKFNAFIPKIGIILEDITIYGNGSGQMGYDYDSFVSALPENFKADMSDGAVMELVKNEERGDIEEIPVCTIYYGEDWVFINEEDYIPLQFTDIEEKTGKEIFEGDIVKIHKFIGLLGDNMGVTEGELEFLAEVKFYGSGVYLETDKIAYDNVTYSDFVVCMGGLHEESFEVIGNIYKNPELLTNS